MKIGLIGLGEWSGKLIKSLPENARLTAVLTKRLDARSKLNPDVKITSDIDAFLSYDLDRIIIANEASQHQIYLAKIRAAFPLIQVLVEKPFATNIEDANNYHEKFGEDKNILVNHTLLFNSKLTIIKENTQDIPIKIFCVDGNLGPVRKDCDSLWDYGPHPLAVIFYLSLNPITLPSVQILSAKSVINSSMMAVDFRLLLNNKVEVACLVGNGLPSKLRKYYITYEKDRTLEFDGVENTFPTPLQNMLEVFCSPADQRNAEGDVRWGTELPLLITKILSEIKDLV